MTQDQYWQWVEGQYSSLGARWDRSHSQLIWDVVEPVIGAGYNWTNNMRTDAMITNIYSGAYKINWVAGLHHGGGAYRDPTASSNLAAYVSFVRAAVERYDGDGTNDVAPGVSVKYWQVGNEIPEWISLGRTEDQYVSFYRSVRAAILASDPSAKVVLIASTTGNYIPSFFTNIIEQLAPKKEFDAVDLHHWQDYTDWKMDVLPYLRDRLNLLGMTNAQIWSCENATWSGMADYLPTQTQEQQAESLVKRCVWNRANGLDKLFWSQLVDGYMFQGSGGSMFNSLGVISDGQGGGDTTNEFDVARLSYFAYQLLAAKTDNAVARQKGVVSGVHDETNTYAYAYERLSDTGGVYVVWNQVGTRTVTLPVTGGVYYVRDMITDSSGRPLYEETKKPSLGGISLTLSSHPLLVQRDTDADADGLASLHELSIGTDPNKADTDGDGASDGAEVAAGTDPLSALSRLAIRSLVVSNATVIVESGIVSGRTYQLTACGFLSPTSTWTVVTGNCTAVSSTLRFVAPSGFVGQPRFYRVEQ